MGSAAGQVQARPHASIVVTVQPLQLIYKPACLQRMGGFFSGMPQGHMDSVLHAVNLMDSPAGRALAKAELAVKMGTLPSIHMEVNL